MAAIWHWQTRKARAGKTDCGDPKCHWCEVFCRAPLSEAEQRWLDNLLKGVDLRDEPDEPY